MTLFLSDLAAARRCSVVALAEVRGGPDDAMETRQNKNNKYFHVFIMFKDVQDLLVGIDSDEDCHGKRRKKAPLECVGNEISSRIRRMPERRKARKVYRFWRFFVLFCQNTFFIAA